jgi:vacuolar protein-sorting-associated protein 4
MSNEFIPKAIELVTKAIEMDNKGDYEPALTHYKKALEYFMTGLKYEKNPATKETIRLRVDGYMKRAEDLKVSPCVALRPCHEGRIPG